MIPDDDELFLYQKFTTIQMNLRSLATDPKHGENKEETKRKKREGEGEEKEMHYNKAKSTPPYERKNGLSKTERADGLSDIYIRNQVRSVLQIDSIVFSFPISLNPHEDTK